MDVNRRQSMSLGLWRMGGVLVYVSLFSAVASATEPVEMEDALVHFIEEVHIPARQEGAIRVLHVRPGQPVRAGDAIAQLEDQDLTLRRQQVVLEWEMATRQAEHDVRQELAEKTLALAQSEQRRAQESVAAYSKSISAAELDRLQLAVDKAELEVRQAAHERALAEMTMRLKSAAVRSVEFELEQRKMEASIDGVVVEVNVRPGEWVTSGQPVVRLVRMDRLRVQGFVPAEALSAKIDKASAEISIQSEQQTWQLHGQVVFVGREVDPVDGQVVVWVEFENPESRVRPGMRARVRIHPPSGS